MVIMVSYAVISCYNVGLYMEHIRVCWTHETSLLIRLRFGRQTAKMSMLIVWVCDAVWTCRCQRFRQMYPESNIDIRLLA
jgi:hypothetical protein